MKLSKLLILLALALFLLADWGDAHRRSRCNRLRSRRQRRRCHRNRIRHQQRVRIRRPVRIQRPVVVRRPVEEVVKPEVVEPVEVAAASGTTTEAPATDAETTSAAPDAKNDQDYQQDEVGMQSDEGPDPGVMWDGIVRRLGLREHRAHKTSWSTEDEEFD